MVTDWIAENIIEIFGAVTGIVYVILEIKRNILLWPLGIITSAVYIYVFGHNGFYANMGLQGYYLVISIYGWYAWRRTQGEERRVQGEEHRAHSEEYRAHKERSDAVPHSGRAQSEERRAQGSVKGTDVIRIDWKTAVICFATTMVIWGLLWFVLDRWTDSPVPLWDGLITSMSVVATWMLTRKYLEQWYVWIVANAIAVVVYLVMGMYPTAVLFMVYFVMAIVGVRAWKSQSAIHSPLSAVPSQAIGSRGPSVKK